MYSVKILRAMLARFKFWEISGVEKSTKIKRVRVERASKACFRSGKRIYHVSNLCQIYHALLSSFLETDSIRCLKPTSNFVELNVYSIRYIM